MNIQETSPCCQPESTRPVYGSQKRIGWGHFVRGRLSREWVQLKPQTADSKDGMLWMTGLAQIILETLLKKWEVCCKIVKESRATEERSNLLQEARQLWARQTHLCILAQDASLLDRRYEPQAEWSVEALRNWLLTRRLAITATESVHEATTSTLDSWLLNTRLDKG